MGVFVYSFLIGTFTSLFVSLDTSKKKVNQMLGMLSKIRKDFPITVEMFKKTRLAIRLGTETTIEDYNNFLEELTPDLSNEIGFRIFGKQLSEIIFFQDQPRALIATVGPHLKPVIINEGDMVCSKGDIAEESIFFFFNII